MECKKCKIAMGRGYFVDGRYIEGEIPKRFLRTSVVGKKYGFATVFRCTACGELTFVVEKLN